MPRKIVPPTTISTDAAMITVGENRDRTGGHLIISVLERGIEATLRTDMDPYEIHELAEAFIRLRERYPRA